MPASQNVQLKKFKNLLIYQKTLITTEIKQKTTPLFDNHLKKINRDVFTLCTLQFLNNYQVSLGSKPNPKLQNYVKSNNNNNYFMPFAVNKKKPLTASQHKPSSKYLAKHLLLKQKHKTKAEYSVPTQMRPSFLNAINTKKKYQDLKKTKRAWIHKKKRGNTKKTTKANYLFFDYIPLQSFFKDNKKLTVVSHNVANYINIFDLKLIIKDVLVTFPFLKFNKVATQLYAACAFLLVYKDAKALSKFIQNVFQKIHYSKHASYFQFIWFLTTRVLGPQLRAHNCLGVQVVFKGKLAVGGDSRKSVHRYNAGMTSSSSKFVKLSRVFSIIRTKTGSVGYSVTVAW